MNSAQEVVDHHLKCFGAADLEGILADYALDAVMFTPNGPLRGRDAFKPMFAALFAEFAKPGASFTMLHQTVEGRYAYLLWNAETADKSYECGSDFMVINEGKIVAHAFAGKITPKKS